MCGSGGETRRHPPASWSLAATRSARRTRHFSARSPAWRCPPRTAGSSCTWPPRGGTYMSSSPAVVANAATLGAGPYEVPNGAIDVYAAYTNNPPCGAMRGFGAVQACFAYESQMDECARRLGLDPVEFRIRNAMSEGSVLPTGQVVDSAAPVAELLRRVRDKPLPAPGCAAGARVPDL